MIITGSLTHSLYSQTGSFSFSADFNFNNPTGQASFGFSGSGINAQAGFSFRNGKILDWRNNLVGFYDNINQVNISGDINRSGVDYYINFEPIAFGVSRITGFLNRIYANATNQRMNMELNIKGDLPNYTLSGSIFNTGDATVPFMIINNSPIAFQIFSGKLIGNIAKFSLQSIPSGYVQTSRTFYLIPSGAITSGSSLVPLDLYTDFGLIHLRINVSGSGQF